MVDLVYVGFVIAGASTLVIEAYRNFNAASARHPFELHPILKDVEVKNLCTTGEIIVGFAFYAALYIIAYAVLLTSAEVYGLLLKANSAFGEIGPTSSEPITGGSDIASLLSSSEDYTKPFAISAVIIASLSLGAVKPIESTMRALAHRLAGVPRGVYKVIENLQRVPYETIVEGYPTPLTAHFDETTSGKGSGTASLKYSYDQIRGALGAIDCLRLATSSSGRTIYFPLYDMERLRPLSDDIDKQYNAILNEISKLQESQPTATATAQSGAGQNTTDQNGNGNVGASTSKASHEQRYSDLADHAKTLAANMMAFFAVLFIRNNRAIYSSPGRPSAAVGGTAKIDPIAEVRKYVFTPERDEKNAFAVAIVIAVAISSLTTYGLYYIWRYWEALADRSLYQPFLKPGSNAPAALDKAIWDYVRSQFELILTVTTREQIFALAITVVPVLLVIIGREVRIEQQSWRSDWSFRQFPFLQFLTMSLLSGLIAVFLAALAETSAVWWETDFHLTETHIVNLFRENGRLFILQAGCGIILSMSALAIMDRRKEASAFAPGANWASTMLIALVGALIFYGFQWFVQFITTPYPQPLPDQLFSRTTRNTLIASGLPCIFLLVFAAFLNPGKKPKKDRARGKETTMPAAAQPLASSPQSRA